MKRIFLFIAFLFPFMVNAQQLLTLKNAIDTALRNNFDIQIAINNAEISKVSNTFGMAGGLPLVNADAGDNATLSNIKQNNNGTVTNLSGVNGNSVNAGVNASMTLFNGFKIIATKEKLNCLQQQSDILLNLQIQNTIAVVMVKYYDILRQQSYLKIIQSSLDVSNKKLDIINEKNKVGMASAVDILQAQTDVNTAEQNFKLQELTIDQDKADLLLLMSVKRNNPISINDSITIDPSIQLDSITSYLKRNPEYLSAELQIKINEQVVKEISSQRYPSIKINTAYDFGQINNSAGSVLMNQSYGPSAGVTLLIPIFNGNIYKTQEKVAVLNVDNSKLQQQSLFTSLSSEANKTFESYSTTLKQLILQQKNYELSKKLVDVVVKNFQLNQSTILDVKAAQSSFEDAAYLLVNLQYAAKTAEIELKQLVYKLGY
jgi:outer membrane protein